MSRRTKIPLLVRMAKEDTPRASVMSERSFSVSLSQALLTADKPLLERLLQTNDMRAIEATVADLPAPLALSLLEFICANMFKAPNQLYTREGWINTILRQNCIFFSQNSRGRASLIKLNKHVRNRLAVNQALLRLKGKVDTVVYMSSIAFRKRQLETDQRTDVSDPLLMYEE